MRRLRAWWDDVRVDWSAEEAFAAIVFCALLVEALGVACAYAQWSTR